MTARFIRTIDDELINLDHVVSFGRRLGSEGNRIAYLSNGKNTTVRDSAIIGQLTTSDTLNDAAAGLKPAEPAA